MKLIVATLMLAAIACSAEAQRGKRNAADDTGAAQRACRVADCFLERDIRHFEVIDKTHVIVYTGAQRCAFRVEVQGTFCDLTFAPELYFRRLNELPQGEITREERLGSFDPFDPRELARTERRDLRVCSNDLGIQVHGGRYTESPAAAPTTVDRFGNPRVTTDCRVASVTSITDDQLLEFYVARGMLAPPPPMGAGEIEVGEQEEVASPASPASTASETEEAPR